MSSGMPAPSLKARVELFQRVALLRDVWGAQDKVDDEAAGVKSTALLFAGQTKPCLSAFAGAQLGLLSLTGRALSSLLVYACPLHVLHVHDDAPLC